MNAFGSAQRTYSLHTLWDGIFQVVGYSVLLWWYLGVAGFAGIALLLIGLPFNAQLQRDLSRLNKRLGELLEIESYSHSIVSYRIV